MWESILETFRAEHIKQFLCIAHGKEYSLMPRFFPKWVEKRIKIGVTTKLILPASRKTDVQFKNSKSVLREVRYLPQNYEYNGSLNIYGNYISLFSLKERDEIVSIVIKSPILADMFREFFLFAWNTLEKET